MTAKSIVVIGGGPDTSALLAGLKRHAARLAVLVSPFERSIHNPHDGESSVDVANHLRGSLLALGADPRSTVIMERLLDYRFSTTPGLAERTFGNLLLLALTEITGTFDLALEAISRVLNIEGRLLSITSDCCSLVVELADGSEREVTSPEELSAAASKAGSVRGLRLSQPVKAMDEALATIRDADIVVLGPADLYFNVLAPLLVEGVSEALAESHAVKVYVCPLTAQPNTTAGWAASRFIRSVLSHTAGSGSIQYVIVNSASMYVGKTEQELPGGLAVPFDLEACLSLGPSILARPVASAHSGEFDPERLARTIMFLGDWHPARRSQKSRTTPAGSKLLAQGSPGL